MWKGQSRRCFGGAKRLQRGWVAAPLPHTAGWGGGRLVARAPGKGRAPALLRAGADLTPPPPPPLSARYPLNPSLLASWASGDPCSGNWAYVTCNATAVLALALTATGLRGTLPTELGALSNLISLSVSSNSLSGTLPTQLSVLSRLTVLSVASNSLSGSIPTQLGAATSLSYLLLSSNALSGTLPTQLANLTGLQGLTLFSKCARPAPMSASCSLFRMRALAAPRSILLICFNIPSIYIV